MLAVFGFYILEVIPGLYMLKNSGLYCTVWNSMMKVWEELIVQFIWNNMSIPYQLFIITQLLHWTYHFVCEWQTIIR